MTKALVIMESVHYDVMEQTQEGQEYSSRCIGVIVANDSEICVDYETAESEGGELSTQRLLIGQEYVKISRPGMGDEFMHFVSGKVTEYVSRTIYGDIFMNVDTKELHILRKEKETKAHIHYLLSAAGQVFTECKMELTVRELEE